MQLSCLRRVVVPFGGLRSSEGIPAVREGLENRDTCRSHMGFFKKSVMTSRDTHQHRTVTHVTQ